MTLQDLGSIGELIAAIATVGTLAYLALQIRQNNESVKISAGQTILSSLNEALQIASSTPQAARVLVLGQNDFESLPDAEQAQFVVWVFAWFRVLEQAHFYHRKGFLEDEVWLGHVEHLKQIMKSAPVLHYWSHRRSFFNPSFQALVDELAQVDTKAPLPRGILDSFEEPAI